MLRREFIKISSAAMGGLALASCKLGSARGLEDGSKGGLVTHTPTFCEICFWNCAGWVYQKDGKPWKIIGNNIDQHSNGRFCTRGTGGIGSYEDEERLKTPLIRTEERGKQVFREASWDEALNFIAKKLLDISLEHGPETVALFSHGSGGGFFKTLMKAYGSNRLTAPSYAQCRGPREEAFNLTFGEGIGSPEKTDIKNTRCLVLIGAHLGENLHNGQVQEFGEAIGRGATIITVDPRFSVAAGKSKYWLPIKPATDLALLLAWIHVIIEEELYDKKYIEKYAMGLDKLKEAVKNDTPEWAYPITSIRPDVIRETAREMARSAPAAIIHPSRHVTWYGDDTQRVRAIAILNALLGSWGRKGGFYQPKMPNVKKYPIPEFPKAKGSWADAFPGQYEYAGLSLASAIRDATAGVPDAKGNKISHYKGWIVYGSNLINCLPNKEKTKEAIRALDLLVAIDTMPAEITGWADVVLPECTYLERYDDLRISQGRKKQIALRAPAFEPKYQSKPGWWIAKNLAEKMNLGEYFPWRNIEDYLEYRLSSVDSSLEEMKKLGVKEFEDNDPLYFGNGENIEFFTPSGKIELYSDQLEASGFDPVPRYTRHPEPPEGHYRLLYGRSPIHTFGRTTNNPLLTQLMLENEVWINPDVASEWGIRSGQYVELINQDGAACNRIKAKVTERIRPDCVYMVHGFGHNQRRMNRSFLKGADDNDLITNINTDPIMGGTGMRNNFVTFKI